MTSVTLDRQPIQRPYGLTVPQVCVLLFQIALIVGAAGWQCVANPSAVEAFCGDALGVQMACIAAVLLVLYMAGMVGGFAVFNRTAGAGSQAPRLAYRALHILWCVAGLLALYLPALFVVLIGPAAVHIRASLVLP